MISGPRIGRPSNLWMDRAGISPPTVGADAVGSRWASSPEASDALEVLSGVSPAKRTDLDLHCLARAVRHRRRGQGLVQHGQQPRCGARQHHSYCLDDPAQCRGSALVALGQPINLLANAAFAQLGLSQCRRRTESSIGTGLPPIALSAIRPM